MIHTYQADTADEITACLPNNPCGAFAECLEDDGGAAPYCECADGSRVDFFMNCPVATWSCEGGTIVDLENVACVCPEGQEEDDKFICQPVDSACSDNPCVGIGSICELEPLDDEGFVCACSDNSLVNATADCDFETIESCGLPDPCGAGAICIEGDGIDGAACECPDESIVDFGEPCV